MLPTNFSSFGQAASEEKIFRNWHNHWPETRIAYDNQAC